MRDSKEYGKTAITQHKMTSMKGLERLGQVEPTACL